MQLKNTVWNFYENSFISLITKIVVGFVARTAVVISVAIFWNIVSCSSYVKRHFRGKYHLHLQGRKTAKQETGMQQVAASHLLQTGFLPGLFSTLKMEVTWSFEMSVHIWTKWCYIPEDCNITKKVLSQYRKRDAEYYVKDMVFLDCYEDYHTKLNM
jgi:hypothetical protein